MSINQLIASFAGFSFSRSASAVTPVVCEDLIANVPNDIVLDRLPAETALQVALASKKHFCMMDQYFEHKLEVIERFLIKNPSYREALGFKKPSLKEALIQMYKDKRQLKAFEVKKINAVILFLCLQSRLKALAIDGAFYKEFALRDHLECYLPSFLNRVEMLNKETILQMLNTKFPQLRSIKDEDLQIEAIRLAIVEKGSRLSLDCSEMKMTDIRFLLGILNVEDLVSRIIHLRLTLSKIAFLPETIASFSLLERLEIESTQLTHVPEALGELKALHYLKWEKGTHIHKLPIALDKFNPAPTFLGKIWRLITTPTLEPEYNWI